MKHASSLLLMLMLHSAPAATLVAAPLDRLFLTPAERIRLERLRQQGTSAEEARPQADVAEAISLDGYVRNSQGKATAWFNQGAGTGRPPPPLENGDAIAHQSALVPVQRGGRRIGLKVGQTYDPATGAIREHYQAWPR